MAINPFVAESDGAGFLVAPTAIKTLAPSAKFHELPPPFGTMNFVNTSHKSYWLYKLAAVCLLALLAAAALPQQQPTKPDPAAIEFFEAKVRPVLADNCFSC